MFTRTTGAYYTHFALGLALIVGLVLSVAAPSSAAIIDDFSDAQGPVVPPVFFDAQTGSMLGGERDVNPVTLGGSFVALGGIATWSSANGGILYDGVDNAAGNALGLGGVDLTDGGLADRFWVDFTAITLSHSPMSVWVYGNTGSDILGTNFSPSLGPVSILFSALSPSGNGADLSAATALRLGFNSGNLNQSASIDVFCTGDDSGCLGGTNSQVPEPGTWLLVAGGLTLISLRRRFR